MEGLQGWRKELPMLTLNSKADLDHWAIGCDKDIGGFSTATLEITPENTGRFYGNISLELPANREITQSGYAAIRSKASRQRSIKAKNKRFTYCFASHKPRPCLGRPVGIPAYFATWHCVSGVIGANISSIYRRTV